jgi:DNA mismatch repair ATPase MutS
MHSVTLTAPGHGKGDEKDKGTVLRDQVHPLTLLSEQDPVANTCDLATNLIVTGPNASGKTTLLKTTLLNLLFVQQFGMGFVSGGEVVPYTHLHSYLNIPDTSERDSLFQAEARRCKDILDVVASAGPDARHFCIFDELYSGTNPVEASRAAYAFLTYLSQKECVHFMLTTHYVSVCHRIQRTASEGRQVANMKMHVKLRPDGTLRYTYRMVPGISKVQGAAKVLEQLGYPADIVAAMTHIVST